MKMFFNKDFFNELSQNLTLALMFYKYILFKKEILEMNDQLNFVLHWVYQVLTL